MPWISTTPPVPPHASLVPHTADRTLPQYHTSRSTIPALNTTPYARSVPHTPQHHTLDQYHTLHSTIPALSTAPYLSSVAHNP
eukprot:3941932-Rhodomonas_salina.2